MRHGRTCGGGQTCSPGNVALDASHIVYLGRGALELTSGEPEEAALHLADVLRATACWQVGRMWTTLTMWDDQIDPKLAELGLSSPSGRGWADFLDLYGPGTAAPEIAEVTGGFHDGELLRRVVDESSRYPTLLVTNDEDMFEQARHRMFTAEGAGLSSDNSTSMMLKVLHCGAVTEDFVKACLVAEYINLEEMRKRGMSTTKYDAKYRRLSQAGRQLALRRYDDEWNPDQTGA